MSYLSCFVLLPVSFTTWVKCLLMKVPRLFNWQETALWGTLLHEWEDELSTTDLFLKIGREKRWNRLGFVWVLGWTAVLLLSSTCNAVLECIIQSCPSSEVKGRGLAIDDSQGEFSVKRGGRWTRVGESACEPERERAVVSVLRSSYLPAAEPLNLRYFLLRSSPFWIILILSILHLPIDVLFFYSVLCWFWLCSPRPSPQKNEISGINSWAPIGRLRFPCATSLSISSPSSDPLNSSFLSCWTPCGAGYRRPPLSSLCTNVWASAHLTGRHSECACVS